MLKNRRMREFVRGNVTRTAVRDCCESSFAKSVEYSIRSLLLLYFADICANWCGFVEQRRESRLCAVELLGLVVPAAPIFFVPGESEAAPLDASRPLTARSGIFALSERSRGIKTKTFSSGDGAKEKTINRRRSTSRRSIRALVRKRSN